MWYILKKNNEIVGTGFIKKDGELGGWAIKDDKRGQGFGEILATKSMQEARKIPEVIEIQTFLGRVDVRLSVLARDMAHYQQIYRSRILTLPHVNDIEALMHLSTVKTDPVLPL